MLLYVENSKDLKKKLLEVINSVMLQDISISKSVGKSISKISCISIH